MKNFVFAFLLFPLFVACNGQSKPEKENISDETQSVLSDESENVPVHLNKVQFLDKVADYEKNPDTWVYRDWSSDVCSSDLVEISRQS